MHAERCPICYGKGSILDGYSTNAKRKCHGCNGKGWIEVSDEPISYPYVAPWPTTWPYHQPTIIWQYRCRE